MKHSKSLKHPDRKPHRLGLPTLPELLEVMAEQARPLRMDRLLMVLGLARRDRHDLESLLTTLRTRGQVLRLRGGSWIRSEQLQHITGRFTALREGGGFVTPLKTDTEKKNWHRHSSLYQTDIYISAWRTGEAWHQDLVRVALSPGPTRGRSPEGHIVEVLERTLREVPALADRHTGRTLYCRPADPRLPVHFRVELPRDAPRPGSLLLLEPLEPVTSDMWSARLVSEYGREDDVSVQEELVKANHEVPRDFSPAALQEASKLPQGPLAEDLLHRKDLRSMPLVTIDDPDARDLDDAVHVQKLSEGGWLLSVAIADVSHYVRPRCAGHAGSLDREALARGNSWYFPQSVEPMLPPALCHGLCSLNPGEDRLAMLVQIPFSSDGQPGKARFASIVMRSAARLTYDQVKTYLLDKSPDAIADFCKQHAHGDAILSMLSQALDLAEQLHSVRQKRGSLDFDLPEMDYRFDNDGRVAWLGHRIRHNAHRLIEEFMIAANEAVARHLCETGLPFLYRVHPKPEEDHLDDLRHSLETVGPVGLSVRPHALQDDDLIHAVLSGVRGTPGEGLVNRLCLRAMPQARYQTNNTGHYGLASQAYCHFTSPIRRYADLLTHRALKTSLGLNCGPLPAGQKLLRIGDTLNHRERAAMDCEREMNKRLSCLALQPRVGESFKGMVSGVMSYGVFVELKNIPVEGMIRVDDLGADHYDYDTNHMCLLGRRSGVVWHLGQEISVVVTAVDLGRLEIRLIPAELPQGLRRGKKDSDTRSRRRTDGPRRHRHSKGSY